MEMEDRDIDFVAKHYRRGLFSARTAWRGLGIGPSAFWRRMRVAAAVAAVVAVSATAAIIYREYSAPEAVQQDVPAKVCSPLEEVKAIDFENAPLAEVVDKIEAVYGVKVENLPSDADGYALSLHYVGSPVELVDVINDILGTRMTVSER